MGEHICEVCFTPFLDHRDSGHWPPRCCHGCPCGETQPDPAAAPQEQTGG